MVPEGLSGRDTGLSTALLRGISLSPTMAPGTAPEKMFLMERKSPEHWKSVSGLLGSGAPGCLIAFALGPPCVAIASQWLPTDPVSGPQMSRFVFSHCRSTGSCGAGKQADSEIQLCGDSEASGPRYECQDPGSSLSVRGCEIPKLTLTGKPPHWP